MGMEPISDVVPNKTSCMKPCRRCQDLEAELKLKDGLLLSWKCCVNGLIKIINDATPRNPKIIGVGTSYDGRKRTRRSRRGD